MVWEAAYPMTATTRCPGSRGTSCTASASRSTTPPSSTSAATSVATGSTAVVSTSHPGCPRRCQSKYLMIHLTWEFLFYSIHSRYVCNECRSAKENDEIYCLCRQPYDESQFYIGCERCSDWFHGRCVGILQAEAKDIDE